MITYDYCTIDGPVHDIFPSIWRPDLSTWIGCSPRTLMQLGTETVEPLQSHFEDLRQSSIVPRKAMGFIHNWVHGGMDFLNEFLPCGL